FRNLLAHGRIRRKRFEQLNQVRPIADPQQHFPHLICSQHIFAMNLRKSHRLVNRHLLFQISLFHRYGYMINKQKFRHVLHMDRFCFYAHTSTTCPLFTLSPLFTFTCATFPATGAVTSVSIFIDFTTIPEMGLRQTLASSKSSSAPPEMQDPPAPLPAGTAAAALCTMNVGS